MRWKQPVQRIPDGAPVSGVSAALRQISDGTTLGVYQSDAEGFVTIQRDGHTEPVYLHLQDAPGGDKLVRSDETHMVGTSCPAEWPAALRGLGDGVVRGYLGSDPLAVTVPGQTNAYSVSPGGAVVYGHPVVIYTGLTNVGLARPTSGTFIYRVVIRLYPTGSAVKPGKADLGLIGPTTDGVTLPALTQTPTLWEMTLARIIVPSSGTVSAIDERVFGGERSPVTATATPPTASTSVGGAGVDIPGSAVTLTLPKATPYTVTARLSGEQIGISQVWAQIDTAGPSYGGTAHGGGLWQMAVRHGYLYVTDYYNHRVIVLNAATGDYVSAGYVTHPKGVCSDSRGYVYVVFHDVNDGWCYLGAYGQTMNYYYGRVILYNTNGTGEAGACCTDDSYVYVAAEGQSQVKKYYHGGSGSFSHIQSISLNTPTGICYSPLDAHLFVVSRQNKSVTKYAASNLAYGYNFSGGTDPIGVGMSTDGTGLWVSDYSGNRLLHFSRLAGVADDTIPQPGPIGVAPMAGEQIWAGYYGPGTVHLWDQIPAGYGSVALDVGGTPTSFRGIGNRPGQLGNVAAAVVQGPGSVTVKGKMRADSGSVTLQGLSLAATATPQD